MFLRLFQKECSQVGKSLIYWLYVICMVLFFTSQMGSMKDNMLLAPQKGQENYAGYGYQDNVSENDIMKSALNELIRGYYYDAFTTYPVGYVKDIRLSDEERDEIADVIHNTTGVETSKLEEYLNAYFEGSGLDSETSDIQLREDMTYEEFLSQMDRVVDILGPGSSFERDKLKGQTRLALDYKGAVKAYENLVFKDGYTGGYTRLFCDYMGIMAAILPIFVVATRMLRDRRAQMQDLIYTRRATSAAIILSRFLAMTAMMMLPLIILSLVPTVDSIIFTKGSGIVLDYLSFLKYDFGWLLPTILVVTAVGMFFTELTDTALAVLIQAAWWFVSLQIGVSGIIGGQYGWNLIPRHNTETNYSGFSDGFTQLAMNRILYTVVSILFLFATIWVYEKKRKGHLKKRGKVLRNRKKPIEA